MTKLTAADRRLTANIDFLKRLQKSKDTKRILKKASCSQLGCLIESMYNVNNGNVPLHKYEVRKLKRHLGTIDALARQRQATAFCHSFYLHSSIWLQDSSSMFRKMRLVPFTPGPTSSTSTTTPPIIKGDGAPFTRFTQDDVDKQRLQVLDQQMQRTLNDKRIPDNVKTPLYNQLLAVFTDLLAELRKRHPQTKREPSPDRYPMPTDLTYPEPEREPEPEPEVGPPPKKKARLKAKTKLPIVTPSPRLLRSGKNFGKEFIAELNKSFPRVESVKGRLIDGKLVMDGEIDRIVTHLNSPVNRRRGTPVHLDHVFDALERASPSSPFSAYYHTPGNDDFEEEVVDTSRTPRYQKTPGKKEKKSDNLFTPRNYSTRH
ncbi:unnamed protein product, partial [Mesorhabditis spiculigera]